MAGEATEAFREGVRCLSDLEFRAGGCLVRRTIIIHGEHDALIPIESARRIHAASGPLSELWPIDDGHGLARLTTDRPELSRAIETLLAK